MPVTDSYSRPKSAVINATPIVLRLKVGEKPNAPALFDPVGFYTPMPHRADWGFSSGGNPTEHETFIIGSDTYEFLLGGDALSNDANIPVVIGESADATMADMVAAINATRVSYIATVYLSDAVTEAPLVNGTENVAAVVSTAFSDIRMLTIQDGSAPGVGVANPTATFAVSTMSAAFNQAANTFNTTTSNLNVTGPYTPGTTSALDCKIQADLDPTGGTDWQDVFRVEATPTLEDTSNGVLKCAIRVTPINGDASNATATDVLVTHPQSMDTIQTAGGNARQA